MERPPAAHGNQTAHGNRRPQEPQRYLDPDVARSVADAKTRSGRSWRHHAHVTGISHPHLILIAQGKRVPSRYTAERIIAAFDMSPDEEEALRAVAVDRGKSNLRSQ